MLKEYSISDIFPKLPKQVLHHACLFEKIDQSRLVWPHKCDFYSIIWFINGYGFNVVDFTEYAISSNRLFLTSPQQIHNWTYHRDVEGYILMFDKIVAAQLGIDFLSPYVDIPVDDIPLLELVIENILRKKPDSDIEIDLLYFYSLIVDKINDGNFDPGGMNTLFRKFKDLIFTDNMKIHSMDQYADVLHIPLTSLNDICQTFAGSSAKQFLLYLKIAEAKRLLIYSLLNVSGIAYRLGFEDASYFARIFKKKTTLTPSAFLEKYRK
ncbi:AraC family transcriptional regulator [Bacteroidia bacterium]|nr:AraC family transcriptional regulator [Bacteroidia bacterium]GHT70802.1 AraC family transcriptional regulator [Bacteroidia bacterium]